MQSITSDLIALLKSRLQAGPSRFASSVDINFGLGSGLDLLFLFDTTGSMAGDIGTVTDDAAEIMAAILVDNPDARFGVADYRDKTKVAGDYYYRLDCPLTTTQASVISALGALTTGGGGGDGPEDFLAALKAASEDEAVGWSTNLRVIVLIGDAYSHDPAYGGVTEAAAIAALTAADIVVVAVNLVGGGVSQSLDYQGQATRIATATGGNVQQNTSGVSDAIIAAVTTVPDPITFQPTRISIDKSLRMTADQAVVEYENEELVFGWGHDSAIPTNVRIQIRQWYGAASNSVRSFTGVVDSILFSRDPLQVTIKARDMMAILLDQSFTTTAPQTAGETGAIRTMANGVYLSMEVSAIVDDILTRAGWPLTDRRITPTSYVLDEFVVTDGSTWAQAIIGDDRLTGLVGYSAWADEDGLFHFEPTVTEGSITEAVTPAYTYRAGEDITSLANEIDQLELRTRVKVRGPLTTQVITDTWRELWRTRKFKHPVGVWYDPADSANIRVLDRGTKRLYKLRQKDRVVLSSVAVAGVCPYPLDVSGDPADATVYYLLNCPWKFGGSLSGNSIKKIRKSDNKLLKTWSIPSGRWTSMQVSNAYIWLTNWDTDKFYKRSKGDASAISSYTHTYGGNLQKNPTGLMVDGTTLDLFWSNSGTTARFLQASESAPGTVTKVIKTAGTSLHGGEMDRTTHTECWGVDDSNGLLAKFTLVNVADQTNEVYAEVIDTDLEDELGNLAQLQTRVHDAHSGDAAHPFEVRRETISLNVITSLAQATETAMRRLDELAKRKDVVDAGVIGNPALQKTDVIRVIDAKVGSARDYIIDTYRTMMDAQGTYVGTLALLPISEVTEVPDDDGSIEEPPPGSEITPDPIRIVMAVAPPLITVDGVPVAATRYWPMLALTSD